MQPVFKQRIGKYASTTIVLLLKTVFFIPFVQSDYEEDNWGNPVSWGLPVELSSAREAEKRWRSS
jgi:hypothetical protein